MMDTQEVDLGSGSPRVEKASSSFRLYLILLAVTGLPVVALVSCILFLDLLSLLPVGTISEETADRARWMAFYLGFALLLFGFLILVLAALSLTSGGVLRLPGVNRLVGRRKVVMPFWIAAVAVLVLIEIAGGLYASDVVRRQIRFKAFAAAAERAKGLIDAIEAYKQANGKYPYRVDDLIPEFIREIPNTNLAGFPRFGYEPARRWQWNAPLKDHIVKDYIVIVNTSLEEVDRSFFFYLPDGKYPKELELSGQNVTPLGKWAYAD